MLLTAIHPRNCSLHCVDIIPLQRTCIFLCYQRQLFYVVTERPTSLPGSTSARPGLGRLLNSHASLLLCHGCQLVSAAKGPATAQCKPSECAFAQAALNSSCIALAALPPSWTVQLMTAVMLVQGHSIDDALHCIHISNHPAQS